MCVEFMAWDEDTLHSGPLLQPLEAEVHARGRCISCDPCPQMGGSDSARGSEQGLLDYGSEPSAVRAGLFPWSRESGVVSKRRRVWSLSRGIRGAPGICSCRYALIQSDGFLPIGIAANLVVPH